VRSLIKVLKALGKEGWLLSIAPVVSINPLDPVPDHKRASKRRRISMS